jgi:ribonuclease HI
VNAKPKLSAAALRVLRSHSAKQVPLPLEEGEEKSAATASLAVDLYCDGASRGNPGPASAGAVLYESGSTKILARHGKRLGKATNNVAEYEAMILGLREALKMGATSVAVHADSELVIKQVKGVYRVKHPEMQERHGQVLGLLAKFKTWRAVHVPREKNAEADRVANQALDGEL